jgi:cytochrome c oxidase subunit IV
MVNEQASANLYWKTWFVLLLVTAAMLILDQSRLPRLAFILVILSGMLVKALLIGAHFMHLRFERSVLATSVVVGLLVNGAILFGLIVPDALRILAMSEGQ